MPDVHVQQMVKIYNCESQYDMIKYIQNSMESHHSYGSDLRYTAAKTAEGSVVSVEEARKGVRYFCLTCNDAMVFRRGAKRRPHFAHKVTIDRKVCSPESVYHLLCKRSLFERISEAIETGRPFPIEWICKGHNRKHQGNLLRKVSRIEIEHRFPGSSFVHDLALYDTSGKPFAAIEVIYTHAPEESVVLFLEKNGILLVCYRLSIYEDVRDYGHTLGTFDVDLCMPACIEPDSQENYGEIAREALLEYGQAFSYKEGDYKTEVTCPKCGNLKTKTDLVILTVTCRTCEHPMHVAFLDDASGVFRVRFGHHTPPRFFNSPQRHFAETHEVYLRSRSDSDGSSTVLNSCSNCQEFYEDKYLTMTVRSYHRGSIKHSTRMAAGIRCHVCECSGDSKQ